MKILHLNLKKKYFDQIKDGSKPLEFRRANAYWRKRLVGRHYDEIHLKCGYPKSSDTDRILKRKWSLIAKKLVLHEEFGAEPVEVFVIDVSRPIFTEG